MTNKVKQMVNKYLLIILHCFCEFPVKVFCPFSLGWLYIIEVWVFHVHSGNDYSIVLGLSSPVGWFVFSLTRVFW